MKSIILFSLATVALAQSLPGDRVIESDARVVSITYMDSGEAIAGYGGGQIKIWDTDTGTLRDRHDLRDISGRSNVAFLPQAGRVAAAKRDGTVEVRDLNTAETIQTLRGFPAHVTDLAVTRDGKTMATAHSALRENSQNTVRVRDSSGNELFAVSAGLGGVSVLGFSPGGDMLVAGSFDADLRVWNASNGELIRLIDELQVSMFAMAFSPDGSHLATAGVDRAVYLWDTSTWKLAGKLVGQPELIGALDFSPDGRRLVTGGFDSTTIRNPVQVIVWDVMSASTLRTMEAPHAVTSTAFSPDGRTVAAVCRDKSIRLWQVPD